MTLDKRLVQARAPSLLLTGLAIAVLHGAYVLHMGVLMAPDTGSYSGWADKLVENGFDYPALIQQARTEFPAALYALFVTLIALLKLAFGDNWALAVVILNLAAHVALGMLLVRLTLRVTASVAAGWVALLFYLGCFELLNWVPSVMSDTIFVWLAFAIFSFAASRILGDSEGWWRVALPATAGVFFRPTGVVLLPDLAWAAYLARKPRLRISAGATLAMVALGTVAGAFLFGWFMQDPGRWPFETLSRSFDTVAQGYSVGEVVNARFETYHRQPQILLDHVLLTADRFVHFFAIGAAGFSLAHWLLSILFFLPCYGLAGWLGFALWRGGHRFGERETRVFFAAGGAVFAYALFHALVQVDFDWRYRVPVIPHLILLAAGGAADLVRRFAR